MSFDGYKLYKIVHICVLYNVSERYQYWTHNGFQCFIIPLLYRLMVIDDNFCIVDKALCVMIFRDLINTCDASSVGEILLMTGIKSRYMELNKHFFIICGYLRLCETPLYEVFNTKTSWFNQLYNSIIISSLVEWIPISNINRLTMNENQ